MINILLTGASGTIGIEVIRLLIEKQNFKLIVFDKKSNRSSKIFAPFKNRMTIIYGDLCNKNDIKRIPDNIGIVIHLGAIIPPLADKNPLLTYNVNVGGTKAMIELLESKSPNAFIFYSSSISVYGDRILNPYITVKDPLNPSDKDLYGCTKIMAEELIKNSKLDWSIFRLTAIMKNHKISKLMFHMPLNTQLEICTPKDTAKAFFEAIYNKEILCGKVFNLGGGENCRISYQKFLEKSFKLFGLGKLNFPLNTFAQKNFHCGYFKDGNILDNILHFRHDSLDSYFIETKHSISLITKLFSIIFRVLIKKALLKQSEPFKAALTNNKELLNHFFIKVDLPLTI